MSSSVTRPRWRLLAPLAVGAALVAPFAGAGAALAAPSSAPDASPQVKAQAVVKPSVVYIQTQWKGWVRFEDGSLLSKSAYTVTTTCSGFVAGSAGYVVTAGHCVDNQTMNGGKEMLLEAALSDAVDNGTITDANVPGVLKFAKLNWKVEGSESGSPPDRAVEVIQTVAASGVAQVQPMAASVVEFKSLDEGDVALLKVETPNPMPALEVADATPDNGADIIAVGYPGSVAGVTDPKLDASYKDGRVSSQQSRNGVPFTEMSAAASPGMSGGPTVDMQGRVVGTVSFSPSNESQQFNFITATSTLKALLSRNAVDSRLNAADQAYRAGLTAYFAGHYHEAVKQFDKVLAAEPNHQQAQAYKAKAAAAAPGEVVASSGAGVLVLVAVLGVVVLVLLGGVILAVVLLRRRRPAVPAVPAATMAMAAAMPVAPAAPVAPYAAPAASVPVEAPVSPAPVAPYAAPATSVPVEAPVSPAPVAHAPVPVEPVQADAGHGYLNSGSYSGGSVPSDVNTTAVAGTCPNCGSAHASGAHFCAGCGRPLSGATVG